MDMPNSSDDQVVLSVTSAPVNTHVPFFLRVWYYMGDVNTSVKSCVGCITFMIPVVVDPALAFRPDEILYAAHIKRCHAALEAMRNTIVGTTADELDARLLQLSSDMGITIMAHGRTTDAKHMTDSHDELRT